MHVGHLLPFMTLFWLTLFGHNAVAVVGGSTASVGDPTGRTTSRAHQKSEFRDSSAEKIKSQLMAMSGRFGSLAKKHGFACERMGEISVHDNSEWLKSVSIMDFLHTLGSKLRMGVLLTRDT
jgi:tyrosyl-tRNA synthetase